MDDQWEATNWIVRQNGFGDHSWGIVYSKMHLAFDHFTKCGAPVGRGSMVTRLEVPTEDKCKKCWSNKANDRVQEFLEAIQIPCGQCGEVMCDGFCEEILP